MGPPCAKTSLQSPKNLMPVCHLVREKPETKNNKCSILPFVPLAPHSNGLSPPETTPPQNYLINHHHQHYPPHTKTCLSNKPSCIKLSMKLPTLSATTEMTGTNSAPRQPTPRGRPRKLPTCPKNNRNTKLPKNKGLLAQTAPTRKSTPLRALPHSPC